MKEYSEFELSLKDSLSVPSFVSLWPEIDRVCKELGFTDVLSDIERIKEYKYISDQLGKMASRCYSKFWPMRNDKEKLLANIEDSMNTRSSVNADERKKVVYLTMRENWYVSLWHIVAMSLAENQIKEFDNG